MTNQSASFAGRIDLKLARDLMETVSLRLAFRLRLNRVMAESLPYCMIFRGSQLPG